MNEVKLKPSTSIELNDVSSNLKINIVGCSNCPFNITKSSWLDDDTHECKLIEVIKNLSSSIDTNDKFNDFKTQYKEVPKWLNWDIQPDRDDPEDKLEIGTLEEDLLLGYYHKQCPLKQFNQVQIVSRLTTTNKQVESYINLEKFFNKFDSNNSKFNIISGDFTHYEIAMLNQTVQLHRKKLPYDKPIIIMPEHYFLSVNDVIKFIKSVKETFSNGGILVTNHPEVISGCDLVFKHLDGTFPYLTKKCRSNILKFYTWTSKKELVNNGSNPDKNFIYLTELLHTMNWGFDLSVPDSIECK